MSCKAYKILFRNPKTNELESLLSYLVFISKKDVIPVTSIPGSYILKYGRYQVTYPNIEGSTIWCYSSPEEALPIFRTARYKVLLELWEGIGFGIPRRLTPMDWWNLRDVYRNGYNPYAPWFTTYEAFEPVKRIPGIMACGSRI